MSQQQGDIAEAIGRLATDPAAAERLARAALAGRPDDADALAVLGAALRRQGRADEALAVLAPLADQTPDAWAAQFELGQALFALGRTREALAPLTRAATRNPGLAAAWRMIGDIRLVAGEVLAAQAAYDRALGAAIGDRRLIPSVEALASGRPGEAEAGLRRVLADDPNALGAAHLLAEARGRQGALLEAEGLLARCLARAPNGFLLRQSHALALLACGRPAQALAEIEPLLARDPADVRTRMTRAAIAAEVGDQATIAAITQDLLETFPDQPNGWLVFGNTLRTLGRAGEATDAYRRALALDPRLSAAWWSLANLKTFRFSESDCAEIEARLVAPGLEAEDRANLRFTLAKAREDAGRDAEAFDHYLRGNAIERERRVVYRPEANRALVERYKALFTPAFFAERAGWGAQAADPIFILGLPRSGSTLVDQILASHPLVEGVGELQDLQVIADWVAMQGAREQQYPDPLAAMPRASAEKLGRDYLDWTRPRRRLGRSHFTDKAPWNFQHIGLIRLILPNARIVDVRRHPMGCCVAAFRQHFSQGWDFAYDLADLGRYYADYVELMAHYDTVLPGRIHRVIYERLVADTEGEVRRLLDGLGLPFDPACLRFFENARPVATPSSEQVRRPIFTDAVDQWRRFEPWLDPLKAALGPVLETWAD